MMDSTLESKRKHGVTITHMAFIRAGLITYYISFMFLGVDKPWVCTHPYFLCTLRLDNQIKRIYTVY